MLLEVNNLTVEFYNNNNIVKAVDNISFNVNHGEIVGIAGESGSGKTVTALSIMQLFNHQQRKRSGGQIIYHHENETTDLLKLSNDEMRQFRGKEIAMIFQEPMTSLNPVLKCGKQVTETILLHEKISKRDAYLKTIELFNKVELPQPDGIYNSYPFQLSGGQQQRVMIAMAISCNPRLLIADEPATSLDATIQQSILKLLKYLQSETGMSIIFITHDLLILKQMAKRIIVMKKGIIVEQGHMQEVYNNPQHSYTKCLLSCSPANYVKGKRLQTIDNFSEPSKTEVESWKLKIENSELPSQTRNTKHETPNAILKVENLKSYFQIRKGILQVKDHEVKAVDNVSFEVIKGETLGLVGESGCGKTTLAKTILRLIEPDSGNVFFNDVNLMQLNKFEMREVRKKIQIIFQDAYSSLNPKIKIGEAIAEPMRIHRIYKSKSECKNKVMELLGKVNLNEEFFNRYPYMLSGGQRQRVVIARALSLNPEFLICDECVSSLDVSVQAQVLNLLNDLNHEFNFTSIFISHDLSVVKYMSDRIIVMHNGKIAEQGITEEVYNNPKSEYTKRLIDALPDNVVI